MRNHDNKVMKLLNTGRPTHVSLVLSFIMCRTCWSSLSMYMYVLNLTVSEYRLIAVFVIEWSNMPSSWECIPQCISHDVQGERVAATDREVHSTDQPRRRSAAAAGGADGRWHRGRGGLWRHRPSRPASTQAQGDQVKLSFNENIRDSSQLTELWRWYVAGKKYEIALVFHYTMGT